MIKYDAHMCHHELTNQIDQSNVDNRHNMHSCDWLEFMLPKQSAITIELTLLSIARFDNHIEHILSDYPNIKKIHIHNSTRLDPRYSRKSTIDDFINSIHKYNEHIEIIYEENIKSLVKHTTMTTSVLDKLLVQYATFMWYAEDYNSYIDINNAYYKALWLSINEYHKDFTWDKFIEIIDANLSRYDYY
jgi:hypothetical protein